MADDPRPFGLVSGRIYASVGDSVDAGRAPDRIGLNGTATFSANVQRVITRTPGAKAMDVPQAIAASIVNGVLQWQATPDVPLIANLDASGKDLGWQWRVDFSNMTFVDPNGNIARKVTLDGYPLNVKIYDQNATADPVTGLNPTVTDLTDDAPVLTASATTLAKGDPGPVAKLIKGTVTTTTDPAAADIQFVATSDPLTTKVNFVYPIGTGGGGGGAGTVTKVNNVSPDGTGKVTLGPADIGAAAAGDVQTAQTTASNALTAANAAATAANTAQTTATNAQNGLSAKADLTALAPFAPLASPAFTGTPTAPTPATTDNSTRLATTASVRAMITAFAPAGGTTARAVVELVWDTATQTWRDDANAIVTARPNAKLVRLNGTPDPAATKPSFVAVGDEGIWHPDSIYYQGT